jgi:hypothetical protein
MRHASTVQLLRIMYFAGLAGFVFALGKHVRLLVGSDAERAPLRQGIKAWFVVPLIAAWPIGLLCWSWLLRTLARWLWTPTATLPDEQAQ